jgi:hypothetical protein
VAATVLIPYALGIILFLPLSNTGLSLLEFGSHFLQQSHASTLIKFDPAFVAAQSPVGYDGQFYYYIAVDPVNGRYYTDGAPYRYSRILYPMAARILALGRPASIPFAMLLVNVLAIAGGTLALAFWLRRRGYAPWFALLYGFYPGMIVALSLDLTEPLAYALVALAVYLFDARRPSALLLAGLAFGLAGLAREISLIFPAVYGLALLLARGTTSTWPGRLAANWRHAALLLVPAFAPFILYQLFLRLWLGSSGLGSYSVLQWPLQGLFALRPWQSWHYKEIWGILLPSFILLAMALWALWRRLWYPEIWALLVNLEVCVFGLASGSFDYFLAPARISLGVALAAVLCLPRFDDLTRRTSVWISRLLWLVPCAALWLWLWLDWLGTLRGAFRV